jgi:transposase
MYHVAIDLGGMKSQVCVREADGTICSERVVATAGLQQEMSRWPQSVVTIETCAEAFTIAQWATDSGHEARIVPATLVKALGVGSRGVKTDKRDARVLSEVSARVGGLPSVHRPSDVSREIKTASAMRQVLVGSRTKLINTVRGWLRQQVIHLRTGKAESFPVRVREAFNERPPYVDRQLEAIDALTTQILAADEDMTQLAEQDEVCTRLMSTPGVGPQTVLRFKCSIDTVERFPNAAQLESYIGLTPGEDSSSERTRRTGINKAGDAHAASAVDPIGLEHPSLSAKRPHCPMEQSGRKASREKGRGGRPGAEDRGDSLRHVARRHHIQPRKGCIGTARRQLSTSSTTHVRANTPRTPNHDTDGFVQQLTRCPETVTTRRAVGQAIDLVAPIVARRRISTYAALTANTRLRQLVSGLLDSRRCCEGICQKIRAGALLPLTSQPLHTRPPTRRGGAPNRFLRRGLLAGSPGAISG